MTHSYSSYNPQIKLSSEEMLAISQAINHEFALNLATETSAITYPDAGHPDPISPQEMLDISAQISHDFAPKATDNPHELVLLPVDPGHLYAYWNVGELLADTPKHPAGQELTLRIYADTRPSIPVTKNSWFDLAILGTQDQQPVALPPRAPETTYSASLGQRYADHSLLPLVISNSIQVPSGTIKKAQTTNNHSVFMALPQPIATHQEIPYYPHNNASGQGKKQQAQ